MNKLNTRKNLAIINFAIVFYFLLIWLLNFYNIDFFLLGFFIELLTIPFLLAQIVFLIIGINYVMKNKRNTLTKISVVLLAICTVITIGSFF